MAVSAVPADGTARHYVGGEPHVPTADWELVHAAVHAAKELEQPLRVGAIASSDTFYDPDPERHKRWSARGVLGVEMEAAVLFTIGALRGVKAGCLLTVSDIVIGEEFTRISDDELRAAVDRMTRVALATVTGQLISDTVFLVNPAAENGAAGRRWPELAHRAAALGLQGDALLSERPGHLIELAREAAAQRRRCSWPSAATGR